MRIVILMTGMLLAGCGNHGNANISGQVFVVTKGRENIKLALVEVAAIPEKDIMQHLNAKRSNRLEQQKALTPELESAKKEADAAKADLDKAIVQSGAEYSKHLHDWIPRLNELGEVLAPKRENYVKISRQISYFGSVEYYFEKLPAQLVASKTDADGKFTLSLPPGKYALAAKSSRDAFGTTENYYWLVWVDTSSPNQSLMLSNDNFFETKCKECVKP